MILAEKIIKLRKQNGWSQEELAARLNVSRQSVSKWEGASSIPDLDKIIKLSELFGVSTDYLLKDEVEEKRNIQMEVENITEYIEPTRYISFDEANTYLNLVESASKKIAAGVALCIVSPVLLILLASLAEYHVIGITENIAGGIGTTILLLMIALAVSIFIMQGMQLDKYEFLEKEAFSLEYGVAGMAEVKKEEFEPVFKKCIASGVALCIISVTPLLISASFEASDVVMIFCTVLMLGIVALAVYLFVWSGMVLGSYHKLLEEGDYSREKKFEKRKNDNLSKVYWGIVTAAYLGISFVTMRWEMTWIIWPCAGVLFAAVCGLAAMFRKA